MHGLRFKVGFRVEGLEFRGLRVGLGFRVEGLLRGFNFKVQG